MTADNEESEILKGLFEEIMKMLKQKQVRVETIVQRAIEQGIITRESFDRTLKILDDYGKKNGWT